MRSQLKLAVLGKLQLERGEEQLDAGLISAKGQALLVYLAVTGETFPRLVLADLLWGEMPEKESRANLRLTLSKLRKSVGEHLLITREAVAFNFEEPYWLDLIEFEAITEKLEQISAVQLRDAVSLYRGDFLEGFYVLSAPSFESWVLGERERLRLLALKALSHLAEAARQNGDFGESIETTRKILMLEPWQEEAHRQLMWLLAHSGQRSAALVQFESTRRTLQEELGVEPAQQTVELYEQIKSGSFIPHDAQKKVSYQTSPPRNFRSAHNLPSQLTPLVGRETELSQVATILANPQCRLLTLVGPGGIGKTRLALAAAEAQVESFGDGVRFVPLGGVLPVRANETAELLVANIANALDYTFSAQLPPRELLLHHLSGLEVFLLLDNFEQLQVASELLIKILHRAPGVKLLVTSQERLGVPAEWVFDVKGLPYPLSAAEESLEEFPAVELFIQRARRIKPDFDLASEATALIKVCQLVEGIPLGIELAASWVRALSGEEIASKLELGLDILTTTSPLVAERHRSMRVVLAHSWEILNQEEQQAFRRLSVFKGGFQLDAAEEVASATLPALAGLVDRSWLRRDGNSRYQIHELVRQFGAEKLAAQPTEQATTFRTHSRYFSDFLKARGPLLEKRADKAVLAELDMEVENIRAAWEALLGQGDVEVVASYIRGLWSYYRHKGWFQEVVIALNQASKLEGASDLQRVYWQRWLGEAHYQMGEMEESRLHFAQAMSLIGLPLPATQAGWVIALIQQVLHQAMHRLWPARFVRRSPANASLLKEGSGMLEQLALIFYFHEKKLPMLTVALSGLNLAELIGASDEKALGYGIMCIATANTPFPRLVRLYNHLAREALEGVERPAIKAMVGIANAVTSLNIGHLREAAEAFDQNDKWLMEHEFPRWLEENGELWALADYHQGQYTQSALRYAETLASAQQRGDPFMQIVCLTGQAENALRLGGIHLDNVMFFLGEGSSFSQKHKGLADIIRLNGNMAVAYLYQQKWDLAHQMAVSVLQLVKGSSLWVFRSLEGYAAPAEVFLSLWENEGNLDLSKHNIQIQNLKSHARQGCKIVHRFARFYPAGQPRAWHHQGLYHWLAGRPASAHRSWRNSLSAAERLSMPYELGRAHFEIGRHTPLDDPARTEHLNHACRIFSSLNAEYDLNRSQEALLQSPVASQ